MALRDPREETDDGGEELEREEDPPVVMRGAGDAFRVRSGAGDLALSPGGAVPRRKSVISRMGEKSPSAERGWRALLCCWGGRFFMKLARVDVDSGRVRAERGIFLPLSIGMGVGGRFLLTLGEAWVKAVAGRFDSGALGMGGGIPLSKTRLVDLEARWRPREVL